MKILLTGTAGQVGGALLPLLHGRADIVAPTREEFDFSRPGELASKLDMIKPDLIINPAAYTAVDRAEDERELAFRINAESPRAIARWAAPRGVPLVHFSTDYVFDGFGDRPWREDSTPGPLSVYGQSKLAGDQAIAEAGALYVIARTSWVYAATGTNFLKTIVRLAGEREQLRIVADQIGAPTTANAISQSVVAMLPTNGDDLRKTFERRGGVVNLVCTGETSWHGFATAIVSGLQARGAKFAVKEIIPIPSDQFPVKAKRPFNSRLDLTRLRERFGITPPSWQQALDRELDALKATI
ncbi:dTDP-4-dehydrorhamnose reductase [Bradyrhizobium sp. WYCCWR 13023]|uniref:dTDP-4-dehydrorhamnose reductase n=1 Tax=Bradyrhizobium zhengyangense TaxID=2911009 RepID=A0A9X1RGG9_9BRAD|nr:MULTISPECIES: dTDP-4-dehydrorhamnose reductase [Bradyrhizobium]MCG2631511.1 dTDP-4-dehydrorhamnose reductase [Bradyrhizobium zhengyangense]MCG2671371.1 dTDP-4-dehydrorhamnose reductase [Bradyrhizobium zhengyangense]MDA9522856.1 dTDP-4-dehydrorhamnose reductase [Bradyrhizobium sp. CCBAU 11434]